MIVLNQVEAGGGDSSTAEEGSTPLHLSLFSKCHVVLERLLKRDDCDVNLGDADGLTPLMLAARDGNMNGLKSLLSRTDVRANQRTKTHRTTALILAVMRDREAAAMELLSLKRTDINQQRRHEIKFNKRK